MCLCRHYNNGLVNVYSLLSRSMQACCCSSCLTASLSLFLPLSLSLATCVSACINVHSLFGLQVKYGDCVKHKQLSIIYFDALATQGVASVSVCTSTGYPAVVLSQPHMLMQPQQMLMSCSEAYASHLIRLMPRCAYIIARGRGRSSRGV